MSYNWLHTCLCILELIHKFIIKLRNWIILFKLARFLVAHDGGKLTWVGELSLAECLQGR